MDGNKRIGAALFLRFLEKNGLLYQGDGSLRLSEEALVALKMADRHGFRSDISGKT
uniref:Fido domain-containing protein n=1 Tax=Desulfacinum infernum TaxID=35837 RepID=A0A832EA27_9BACT